MKALFFFLLIVCSFCLEAQDLRIVKGKVMLKQEYCGGANPGQENLELVKEKPVPNKVLVLKRGNRNRPAEMMIRKVRCDEEGIFQIRLHPGEYCLIDEDKTRKLSIPKDTGNYRYQADCMKKEYERCDKTFVVRKKDIIDLQLIFVKHCPWSTPCIQYTGPLPPRAQ